MKTIQTLPAAALLTLSTTASAINCEQAGNLAAAIMEAHQKGVSLSDTLANFQAVSNAAARQALKELALDAYDAPRYSTPAMQQKAIRQFRDDETLKCHKARQEPPIRPKPTRP